MYLKLSVFFSFFLAISFADLYVYDLSNTVDSGSVYMEDMKCSGGQKIVAWVDLDGDGKYHVHASLVNGTGYDSYDLSGAVSAVQYVDFAINASGQAVVFWVEGEYPFSNKCSVWNGSSWNASILAENLLSVETTVLALSANGNAVVAWVHQNSNSYYDLFGAYWNGADWSIQQLDPNYSQWIFNLQDCIDPAGLAAIDWLGRDFSGPVYHLRSASWNGGGPAHP